MSVCECGHDSGDHHSSSGECEHYGWNENGGMMPVHPDGEPCPVAALWFARSEEDGVWRTEDGRTRDECFCWSEHAWTPHCGSFAEKLP